MTGVASNGSFMNAIRQEETFGGGFNVRASTGGTTPITDIERAVAVAPGLRDEDIAVAASQSFLPIEATQKGTGRPLEPYVVRGLDEAFLGHTSFDLGKVAEGYGSSRDVWNAIASQPNLAVVDSTIVPRRDNFNFAVPSDFRLSGFYFDEGTFEPIPIELRDPRPGRPSG